MSFRYSWIAVKDAAKADLLAALEMEETSTGMEVLAHSREVNVSYRAFPNGWTVVFGEDFEWATNDRLLALSRVGMAVACQCEDQVENATVATGAEYGVELWRVSHSDDSRKSPLDVSGDPPAEFASIRDRLLDEQKRLGDADYLSDIPVELAKAVCGYRFDDNHWEQTFVALKPIGEPDEHAAYGRRRRQKAKNEQSGSWSRIIFGWFGRD